MDSRTTDSGVADAPWYHGGNLNAARRLFPGAPEPWIDLSTGINPVPYPVGDIPPEAFARLPEPADLAALEGAARQAYGAGGAAEVVPAPGTQAIIQWLPHIVPARRVAILGPTYQEHARTWHAAGCEVLEVASLDELEGCDVGVVVNPNNPDGRLLPPERLAAAARRLAARGGLLVVDEAFMDVMEPESSLVPTLPEAGAVVLRSFGKTYGLAGLRLGFAVAAPDVAAALRAALGPWAVSGPAIAIGCRALADRSWLTFSTQRLIENTLRLDTLLTEAGFAVLGGTPLFRLAEHAQAKAWFSRLGHAGILTRPFANRPSALRLAAPNGGPNWERLETALRLERKS